MKHDLLSAVTILVFTLLATGTAPATIKGGPWKPGDIIVKQASAKLDPDGARAGSVYPTVHNTSGQNDLLFAVDSIVAQ